MERWRKKSRGKKRETNVKKNNRYVSERDGEKREWRGDKSGGEVEEMERKWRGRMSGVDRLISR